MPPLTLAAREASIGKRLAVPVYDIPLIAVAESFQGRLGGYRWIIG